MVEAKYRYYFVLGTNHSLSKVDIINVLFKNGVTFEILEASEEILLIETENKLGVDGLMLELGGAIKIGQIFDKYSQENFPRNFLDEITAKKFKEFFLTGGSMNFCFGVSVYNGGGGFKTLNKIWLLVPKIARLVKEKLGIRYLHLRERKIPSFLVDKAGFLSRGFELVMVSGNSGVYIGKTLVLHDYKSYRFRDYGRPKRDAKSGMIPPKLAKTMINLAGKNKNQVFLDPFCGDGTFLQELVLLRYKNIIGTDLEEKAIRSTKENLDWLFKKYSFNKDYYKIKFFKNDVRYLSSKLPTNSIDAIVTEPYLGSPNAKYFSFGQIKEELARLAPLYISAFMEFGKLLKKDGVIVIVFPIFKFKNQFSNLEILEKIHVLGFKEKGFINQKLDGSEFLKLNITSRNSIVFFHPRQTISREIFVFTKVIP